MVQSSLKEQVASALSMPEQKRERIAACFVAVTQHTWKPTGSTADEAEQHPPHPSSPSFSALRAVCKCKCNIQRKPSSIKSTSQGPVSAGRSSNATIVAGDASAAEENLRQSERGCRTQGRNAASHEGPVRVTEDARSTVPVHVAASHAGHVRDRSG